MPTPLPTSDASGSLILNGVSCYTEAWTLLNIRDLWFPAPFRGRSIVVPYGEGGILRRRRQTLSTYTLKMVFHGEYDRLGNPSSTPGITLQENIDYFREEVVERQPDWILAQLFMPDGSERQSAVVVNSFQPGKSLEDVQEVSLQIEAPTRIGFED